MSVGWGKRQKLEGHKNIQNTQLYCWGGKRDVD